MKNKKLYLLNIILVGIFLLTGNQTAAQVSGSSPVLRSFGNIELGEYLTESMVRKSFNLEVNDNYSALAVLFKINAKSSTELLGRYSQLKKKFSEMWGEGTEDITPLTK